MVKKSRIVGLLLSLVFIFTGILSVGVSARKKFVKSTEEKRAKILYEAIEQEAIAYDHLINGVLLKLKIHGKNMVDHPAFKKINMQKQLLLGGRNFNRKLFKANRKKITNFEYSELVEYMEEYLRCSNLFNKKFDQFIRNYGILKKIDKDDKKIYKSLKIMREKAHSFLEAIVKTEKKKIRKKKKKTKKVVKYEDDDDEDDEEDDDDD